MLNKRGLGSINKKGQHELKRKQNRKRMRLHRLTTEGKIGPNDNTDTPHSFAWTKPETKKQEQRRLAKELANAVRENEIKGAGAQQIDPSPSV
jgi:hypothetical protein